MSYHSHDQVKWIAFYFVGISIFLWAFSGHSSMARALPNIMFSTYWNSLLCTVAKALFMVSKLFRGLWKSRGEWHSHHMLCCEQVPKHGSCCPNSWQVFSQLEFEVDKNWVHQCLSLLYAHAQVSSKTNLALIISLGLWNESRNKVHPFQIKAFKDSLPVPCEFMCEFNGWWPGKRETCVFLLTTKTFLLGQSYFVILPLEVLSQGSAQFSNN